MEDLVGIVDVCGPGVACEFVCETIVGCEVLAACGLGKGEILCRTAPAVEFAIGMDEIHAGTADGVDRMVLPLRGVPERIRIPGLRDFQNGMLVFAAAPSVTEQPGGLRTGVRPAGRSR